jgi:hypothetical protein
MPAPRPVTLVAIATPAAKAPDPEPLGIVGGLPAATASSAGGVKRGVAVASITPAADGTAAGTTLNALLASLRAAGVIAP